MSVHFDLTGQAGAGQNVSDLGRSGTNDLNFLRDEILRDLVGHLAHTISAARAAVSIDRRALK